MKAPNETPQVVTDSVKRWCASRNLKPEDLGMKWDSLNGNYYFERDGVYYGIELNGYIHT